MTESIVELRLLQELALKHALAVVQAEANDGSGSAVNMELLREFQRERQPFLSDKQYTALFRTYLDLVMTHISNHYDPGSRQANPPVLVSSIKDGEEIYRPNAVPMNPARWDFYIAAVVAMAERFAHEVAELAITGGDVEARMEEQKFEAAQFSLDHGLTPEEMSKENEIYKEAFVKALERETNLRTGGTNT